VRAIFGRLPEQVTYVAVDFNTQRLDERLQAAGYDAHLKTLVIWQGVTMYLTPAAVDATLAFFVEHSAPSSRVVFDYIYQSALDGARKQNEVSNMRRYRRLTGEPLTFGIPEGSIHEFLKSRGFSQVSDWNAQSLRQAYFTGKIVSRQLTGGYGIAVAVV
jgi:methyltransferase (TIGR00027 family)